MTHYVLDKDIPDSFDFELGGKIYRMRYPIAEEVDEARKKISKPNFDYKKWMYTFIDPIDDAPPIEEALKKVNVKVISEFNRMITEEFNSEL